MSLRSAWQSVVAEMRDPGLTRLGDLGRVQPERRGDPLNNPAVPLSAAGFLAWAMAGEPTASGEQVTLATSLQQITVYACVRVIAESVASLPVRIYERQGKSRNEAADHPLADLLAVQPNPEMSAFTFWETLAGSLALTGNCYAEIQRDNGNRIVYFWPLHPELTRPKRDSRGELIYETSSGMPGSAVRYIEAQDMFHVPLFCFDGLKGLSPIALARQGIGLARAAEKFGARFFGNGARPGGILSTPQALDDPEIQTMRESWERTQGGANQGRTAVMPGDWKYTQIGISPEDSQFLETRQFQRSEIAAGIFRVPPHKIGDNTRLSNANYEQAELSFVTDTLRPYLARFEAECMRKFMPSIGRNSGRYFVEFDVSERLRGDFKTMMEGFATGKQWGFWSTNGVLEKLGENPIGPSGDIYLVPVNMQNAERLLDTESIQDQPIPGADKKGEDPDGTVIAPGEPEVPALTGGGGAARQLPAAAEAGAVLDRYTLGYIRMYRDAFRRLWARQKRDAAAIQQLFRPILHGIADLSLDGNGDPAERDLAEAGAAKHVEGAIEAMARRAERWKAEDDPDVLAQDEFLRAVRAIHINVRRDAAAREAEASLRREAK